MKLGKASKACCGLMGLSLSLSADAIDLRSGDLTVLPAGTSLVQFAYVGAEQRGLYRGGSRVSTDPEIRSDVTRVRLMHYFSVANKPAAMYVQQPWGTVHANGLSTGSNENSGFLDTAFFLAFWPYSNPETKTYTMLAAYYTAPTGDYDNKAARNLGENRHRAAWQAGYQTRIGGSLDWLIAADVIYYGTNEDFGLNSQRLERKPLSTLQTGVNYFITPTVSLGASYFHTFGGATTLDGISRDDKVRVDRFMLHGNWRLQEIKSVVTLQYGRDIDTENGLLESRRVLFRFTTFF